MSLLQRTSRTTSKRTAFTLVEMLVAVTIGSLLLASVVSATRALTRSRVSVDLRATRESSARQAMEAIVGALRNVRCDPISKDPLVLGVEGGGDQSGARIDLLVTSDRRCRQDATESDQYELSFFLEQRAEQPLPSLMCRRDHAFDDYPGDGGIVSVVADGIVDLSFEYLSDERWQTHWSELERRLPDAVRVTVGASAVGDGEMVGRPEVTWLSTVIVVGLNRPAMSSPPPEGGEQPKEGGPRR